MGLDYKQMEEEEGCGISVVDVHARYRAPARYDDELVIETRLLAARGAVVKFGYRILRVGDGGCCARERRCMFVSARI